MPQAWFNQAEAYFRLNNVHDRTFWFYYVQWVLTAQQKKLVRDLLSIPTLPTNAYNQLKERLLQLYKTGEKDRCRKYLAMPPLGGRRPSELVADLMVLCPRSDVEGGTIKYMFLFRLPPTMQALLGEDNTPTLTELAARADALLDGEVARDHNIGAVEESTVAAAGVAAPPSSRKRKRDFGKAGAAKRRATNGGGADPGPWADMGLCWSHYNYGKQARKCKPPCSWQGN